MKRFTTIVIVILALLFIGREIYNNHVISKLQDTVFDLSEDKFDTIFSEPELIQETPAVISKKDGVLVPKIVYKDTGSVKTVKIPVIAYDTIKDPFDTAAFLVDYFSLKMMMDSITAQDVEIKVFDTLQKNTILGRQYQVKNLRTEDFYNRRKFYVGGTLGGSSESFSIGPSLSYLDKRGNLFSGHYLFSAASNQSIFFSYGKKISLKRK